MPFGSLRDEEAEPRGETEASESVRWRRVYLGVLAYTLILYLLLGLFSRYFAP
ncbi:MAG TPA: hypothetical protein P5057_02975 [Acidobacteriota bacterium]|nr:hypothetical protein [Acidobacteriota bacterium]